MTYPSNSTRPVQEAYPHPCTWKGCTRRFTCQHNVQQHIREKHTLERPNQCQYCHKAYARPWTLNRHMRAVHGIDVGPGRGGTTRNCRRAAGAPIDANDGGVDIQQQPLPNFESILARDAVLSVQVGTSSSPVPIGTVHHLHDSQTTCQICYALFATRNDPFIHLHGYHYLDTTPYCYCCICRSLYLIAGLNMRSIQQDAGAQINEQDIRTIIPAPVEPALPAQQEASSNDRDIPLFDFDDAISKVFDDNGKSHPLTNEKLFCTRVKKSSDAIGGASDQCSPTSAAHSDKPLPSLKDSLNSCSGESWRGGSAYIDPRRLYPAWGHEDRFARTKFGCDR